MRDKRVIPLFFLLLAVVAIRARSQEIEFSWTSAYSTFAEARAKNSPPTFQNGSEQASAMARGDEGNPCPHPHLNISSGQASARTDQTLREANVLGYKFLTSALATGGHQVRCNTCPFRQCIGINGQDYGGYAFSRAQLSLDIHFPDETRLLPYRFRVQTSLSQTFPKLGTLRVRLTDALGETLLEGASMDETITIAGGSGRSYRLVVESIASAEVRGAGVEQIGSEANLTVTLKKAPLMEGSDNPIITGGRRTSGFSPVGALLVDGRGQCTGTLIGPNTVLTAAHCVYRYAPGDLEFTVGEDYTNKSNPTSGVDAIFYPQHSRDGFQYDPANLNNDIAVLHLTRKFDEYYPLPEPGQMPDLGPFFDDGRQLIFVGFGNRVARGIPVDPGPKRQLEVPISTLTPERLVFFSDQGRGVCGGDSGGPALIPRDDKFVVVGIASAGDCAGTGWHMRVGNRLYLDFIRKYTRAFDTPAIGTVPPNPVEPCPCAGTPQ